MREAAVEPAAIDGCIVDIHIDNLAEHALREEVPAKRSLLIVDNDRSFLQRLAKALEQRGFCVATSESVADSLQQVEHAAPAFAVIEMRLSDGNGLT